MFDTIELRSENLPVYPTCSMQWSKPCPFQIIKECGYATKHNLTPNQVCDRLLLTFAPCIDRKWLLDSIVEIQINWFKSSIVVGVGIDFPFEFSKQFSNRYKVSSHV